MPEELTIRILGEIRDGITSMHGDFNRRLDATNERLDATNERLEGAIQRLDRVGQGLVDLGHFMRQIALDQARHERFHLQHVDVLEKDMRDLQMRVAKLERNG